MRDILSLAMSIDATVEHWIAWLDLGVTLRIPETSIPYCDVHRSTLRSLGGGSYERADEWSAFEAGHGRYGSTDHKTFDLASLRAELRSFAQRSADRVRPLDENATPVLDAAEALALVRRGEQSISPWFASADRELKTVVVGNDGEAYTVGSKNNKLVSIERLDPADDAHVKGLCIARSALTSADAAMSARARRHCERRDELLRELASNHRLALSAHGVVSCTHAGRHFPGIVHFHHNQTLFVRDLDAHELRRAVALALLANEELRAAPHDDRTLEEVHALEDKLDALRASMLGGEIAFQRNTSLPTWWVWVDSVPRAVDVRDQRPIAIVDDDDVAWPSSDVSSFVSAGWHPERFHPVDEAFRQAVRDLLVQRGAR